MIFALCFGASVDFGEVKMAGGSFQGPGQSLLVK